MSMSYNEILNMPEFESIEAIHKQALIDLIENMEGKNIMESINMILEFTKNMPQDKSLSQQDQDSIINAILSKMNEEEQERFNKIMNIAKNM